MKENKTLKTLGLIFKTNEVVKSKKGTTLDDYVYNGQDIINQITNEIVEPVLNQKTGNYSRKNPLLIQPSRPAYLDSRSLMRNPLRNIGRGNNDLFTLKEISFQHFEHKG